MSYTTYINVTDKFNALYQNGPCNSVILNFFDLWIYRVTKIGIISLAIHFQWHFYWTKVRLRGVSLFTIFCILFEMVLLVFQWQLSKAFFHLRKIYIFWIWYPVDLLIREEIVRKLLKMDLFESWPKNYVVWIVFKKKFVFLAEFMIDSIARSIHNLAFEVKDVTLAFETKNRL